MIVERMPSASHLYQAAAQVLAAQHLARASQAAVMTARRALPHASPKNAKLLASRLPQIAVGTVFSQSRPLPVYPLHAANVVGAGRGEGRSAELHQQKLGAPE